MASEFENLDSRASPISLRRALRHPGCSGLISGSIFTPS